MNWLNVVTLTISAAFITFFCMINPTDDTSHLYAIFHQGSALCLFVGVPVVVIVMLCTWLNPNYNPAYHHVFSWMSMYHAFLALFFAARVFLLQQDSITQEFFAIYHSYACIVSVLTFFKSFSNKALGT